MRARTSRPSHAQCPTRQYHGMGKEDGPVWRREVLSVAITAWLAACGLPAPPALLSRPTVPTPTARPSTGEATPAALPVVQLALPDGREVPMARGGYTWCVPAEGGLSGCVHAGTAAPDPSRATPSVVAGPGAHLRLRFSPDPLPGSLHVERWSSPRDRQPVPIADATFEVDGPSAVYVYVVTAKWGPGTVSHAAAVQGAVDPAAGGLVVGLTTRKRLEQVGVGATNHLPQKGPCSTT